ncbi:MAG TPA: hypothetical protein VHL77_09505 [Ferruginibacter sp.]|jgi:hypothetical protein|nr:hypothetical protein [Ferruginibacter sp.]
MKIKQLFFALTMAAFAIAFNSCKKSDAKEEFETTFELSTDQAIADNLAEDANDMFMQVATENNVAGNFAPDPGPSNFIPCATVTITPAVGFPKTILIDFGTSCSYNGNTRSGKIQIVISDSVRRPGSTAVMTFDNYYINLYKVEGTYTWTNTSTPNTRSWSRRTEGGKITAPDSRYWLHSGMRYIIQTAGVGTPTITDDVFSITGDHTVQNSAGATRVITVLEALQKKNACANIDKGKLKVQGPNHYAVIDFGDGTCDNLATLSIDGRPSRVIVLR